MAALLRAQNLNKTFKGREGPVAAVKNLSFEVMPGELVGLMGPNGAGKSTTLRLLSGYIEPDSGRVEVGGFYMDRKRADAQHKLGYLAEHPAVYEDLTPYEYLDFLGRAHGVRDLKKAVEVVARLARCGGYMHRSLGTLSKGMKQRVYLAGALINDPPVLLLDEPTDGLDPNQKHELRLVLKELARSRAIVVSTHILEEAEAMCTRVMIMNRGQIQIDTTPAKLASHGKGDIQLAFRILTQNRGNSAE
jgi:ABC-2 type transport system ATP-binding protein